MKKCTARVEVYARVCGFFRPVQQWNKGKKEEYADRTPYVIQEQGKKRPPLRGDQNSGNQRKRL